MKIILIITDYGSFNNFLSELAVAMIEKEIEVHITSSRDNVIKVIDKYDFTKFNIIFHNVDIPRTMTLVGQIKSAIQIRRIINREKPDIVHSHFTTGIFPTILFKKRRTEYWGTFHGLGMNATSCIKKAIFTIIETFCFFRLNRIYLVNKQDFTLVQKRFKNKATRYQSYGFGCDSEKFNRNNLNKEELFEIKHRLKIDNTFVIVYTGRFVEFKGFDLVYHSFNKLNELFPNKYSLLLVGGKDPVHSTGLTELEWQSLAQNPSIINVGHTSEVQKYLAVADVFLFPSKKEGLPTCIVEALSMGLPVVTLNERGNSDIIQNDYNGYLLKSDIKINEIERIVKAISNLQSNPAIISKFSINAIKDRNKYSRSIFINEHLDMYLNFNNKSVFKINSFRRQN